MAAASDTAVKRSMKLIMLLLALALAAAACGEDEPDEAAGEAADDTDDPVEEEADDDEDDPGDELEDEAAEETEDGAEPESNEVTMAYSAGVPQVEKVPTNIALDNLEDQGFDTDIIYLESSEDPINAVARGDANFGSASATAVFTAIGQGAPLTAIMQANGPNYVLPAPAGSDSPEDLDGLRFGIHAEVSSTALYLAVALEDYPEVEPEVLVVPGSANRIEAMAAGELDSSVIQISDVPRLEELAEGEYDVIWNFAQENPNLIDSVLFTHDDTLEEDPALVDTVIEASLDATDYVYDNVDSLADWIAELVPDTDEELAQELAELYTDSELWPHDGGLSPDGVELTIDTLVENELMDAPPELEWAYDREPLERVLEQTGR